MRGSVNSPFGLNTNLTKHKTPWLRTGRFVSLVYVFSEPCLPTVRLQIGPLLALAVASAGVQPAPPDPVRFLPRRHSYDDFFVHMITLIMTTLNNQRSALSITVNAHM